MIDDNTRGGMTFGCSRSFEHSILKRFGDVVRGIGKVPRNVLQKNDLSLCTIVWL